MSHRLTAITGLIIVAVITLAVNLIANVAFQRAKIDMTEENLYTLSKGSRNILASLDEDISAKFYYSRTAAADQTFLKSYAERVIEMLREYEAFSKGRFKLEIIDPRPDTEEEAWAERYGLQPAPAAPYSEGVYMGLVMKNESGDEEIVPFFNPQKEETLEYDLSKAIVSLSNPEKKKVGVLSSLPVMGRQAPMNPMNPQAGGTPPWMFVQELKGNFDVVEVEGDSEEIPDDLDLLLLIHPKELGEAQKYAVDQYVLKGGRLMVFVDPFCETDQAQMNSMMNMQMRMQMSVSSDLPELFEAWGVELDGAAGPDAGPMAGAKIVGDRNIASPVRTRTGIEPMIAWLSLTDRNLSDEAIVTNGLESLVLASAGALKKVASDENIEIETLMETSDEAALLDSFTLRFGMNPEQMAKDFEPGASALPLAVKISGKFKTAFPDGPPESEDEGEDPEKKDKDSDESKTAHLTESREETTILVVADVDMLSDDFSVQKQRLFGQEFAFALNDNLAFVSNAVENLTGSQDLIALRSRGQSRRPFTRVMEIERRAQERWRQEEKQLEEELQQAEQRLSELQRGTKEQRVLDQAFMKEIERLREKRLETRAALRDVRRNLREDVERLGFLVKLINIGLVPALVCAISVLVAVIRSYRRREAS